MKLPFSSLLITGLLVLGVIPQKAHAQASADIAETFCSKLSTSAVALDQAVTNTSQLFADKNNAETARIIERRANFDDRLVRTRQATDGKLQTSFEALRRKEDAGDVAAVEAYISVVATAVAVRRSAYDAARTTFRLDVDALRAQQIGVAQAKLVSFATILKTANKEAASNCENGRFDPLTVQNTYTEVVKQARKDLAIYNKTRPDVKSATKELIKTRNLATEQARREFEQTMQQAQLQLRQR
jgi:hypothetical protein